MQSIPQLIVVNILLCECTMQLQVMLPRRQVKYPILRCSHYRVQYLVRGQGERVRFEFEMLRGYESFSRVIQYNFFVDRLMQFEFYEGQSKIVQCVRSYRSDGGFELKQDKIFHLINLHANRRLKVQVGS